MLDHYSPNETTKDELEIIEDQYLACKKTPATIHRLAAETQHSEGLLGKFYFYYYYFLLSFVGFSMC
jgi:hypothetical protein